MAGQICLNISLYDITVSFILLLLAEYLAHVFVLLVHLVADILRLVVDPGKLNVFKKNPYQ